MREAYIIHISSANQPTQVLHVFAQLALESQYRREYARLYGAAYCLGAKRQCADGVIHRLLLLLRVTFSVHDGKSFACG